MSSSTDSERYNELFAEYELRFNAAQAFRKSLASTVCKTAREFAAVLRDRPGVKTSSWWLVFDPYWQSFDIYVRQLNRACAQLRVEQESIFLPLTPSSEVSSDDIEDLEDAVDAYRSFMGLRAEALIVLELIDTADRLITLRVSVGRRKGNGKGKAVRFVTALGNLKSLTRKSINHFQAVLSEMGIVPIPLYAGDYPDPALTRVTARLDDGKDDNVVIHEIGARGFMWRGKLLRKADVVVITQGS